MINHPSPVLLTAERQHTEQGAWGMCTKPASEKRNVQKINLTLKTQASCLVARSFVIQKKNIQEIFFEEAAARKEDSKVSEKERKNKIKMRA